MNKDYIVFNLSDSRHLLHRDSIAGHHLHLRVLLLNALVRLLAMHPDPGAGQRHDCLFTWHHQRNWGHQVYLRLHLPVLFGKIA
jgi:hypothetical protein